MMHQFFHHGLYLIPRLTAWLESWVSTAGFTAVFAVAFFESIPPLGLLVPTHTVIMLAGFLAKVGIVSLSSAFCVAMIGLIAGDAVGYWMGRRYGYDFLVKASRVFYMKEETVEKMKILITANPIKAVFIGTMNPLTRGLTPFLVGASKVSFSRFMSIAFASGAVLTAIDLCIGYLFGAGYHAIASYVGKVALIGMISVILIFVIYRFINKRFHVFARYELFSLVANLLALAGFAFMLQGIAGRHAFMLQPDVAANIWFYGIDITHAWLVTAAYWTSAIISPITMSFLGLVLAAWFANKRRWRHFVIIIASIAGGAWSTLFLKGLIANPRPPDAFISVFDYSFPSGHATAVGIALALILYFFLPPAPSHKHRVAMISVASAVALAVGLSRLFLEVHWLSDVVAGYCLGIFSATTMILLVRYGGLIWKAIVGIEKAD